LNKDDFRQKLQYKYDLKSGGRIAGSVTLKINNIEEKNTNPQNQGIKIMPISADLSNIDITN